MDRELTDKLFEDCPTIFRFRSRENTRALSDNPSLMFYGFACGDGWHSIIRDLSLKLEALALQQPEDERLFIFQVKQKFGGLCYYTKNATKEMRELVGEAVSLAAKTCEHCGSQDSAEEMSGGRSGRWVMTVCSNCAPGWKSGILFEEDE